MRTNCLKLALGIVAVGMAACKAVPPAGKPFDYTLDRPPAYDSLVYWAAHPAKDDPSDYPPKPLQSEARDTSVAVFFVHPTTYLSPEALEGSPTAGRAWNASLQNEALNLSTLQSSIKNQATPFNRYALYAPHYRQAHIRSYALPDSLSRPLFDLAYADVRLAFKAFLQRIGHKPFIVASHSQGTMHAARLLKEEVQNTPLQQRLVVAYLVGMPVRDDYFASLPLCTTPTQTGCYASWRTYREGTVPGRIAAEQFTVTVVNPVSWTTDTLPVPKEQHKGAVLYEFDNIKRNNVRTQVKGNKLWSSKPRFLGSWFFNRTNYHIGDINLFWLDIRENAAVRVRAFREK